MKELHKLISNYNEEYGTFYTPILCEGGSVDIVDTKDSFRIKKSYTSVSDALENINL